MKGLVDSLSKSAKSPRARSVVHYGKALQIQHAAAPGDTQHEIRNTPARIACIAGGVRLVKTSKTCKKLDQGCSSRENVQRNEPRGPSTKVFFPVLPDCVFCSKLEVEVRHDRLPVYRQHSQS